MLAPFFDTNIVIDWMFERPQAIEELSRYASHRLSRIAWTELLAGEPAETRREVQTRLQSFEVVEVDQRIALAAADIRFGSRMKLIDALILATARAHGAVLVTRNTRDFPRDMPGVHIPYAL